MAADSHFRKWVCSVKGLVKSGAKKKPSESWCNIEDHTRGTSRGISKSGQSGQSQRLPWHLVPVRAKIGVRDFNRLWAIDYNLRHCNLPISACNLPDEASTEPVGHTTIAHGTFATGME